MAGVEYNADCWAFRLVGQRLATTTQTTTNSVYLQIELNGLARFGTNPLELLRRSVPGYQQTNDPTVSPRFRDDAFPGILRSGMSFLRILSRVSGAIARALRRARRRRASARRRPCAGAHAGRPRPRRQAPAPASSRGSASLDRVVPLDRVIAIVNDEALTQYDVNEQKRVVLGQMKTANVTPPSADVLEKQLLERLITERVLLQYAKETGIRVDDTQVERTLARIAEDNKLSTEDFRKAVEREGIPYAKYRSDIRNEITIQRLREREVEGRVNVSDAEVDHLLATLEAQAGGEVEYRLAHILVLVPEQASPDQIDVRQRRAETALAAGALRHRLRSGRRGLLGRAGCAAGRHARLAHAGAPADGIRRPGAQNEAGRRVCGAPLRERLSHRQAARDAQPQFSPTVIEQTRLRHILDQGQRNHVERRSAGSRSIASGSGSSRVRSSRTRRRPTRKTPARRKAATSDGCRPATRCPTSSGR